MADQSLGTPVLVTTEHRGVFFGYLIGEPSKAQVTLARARNCLHWTADVRGFGGLASSGPSSSCRIGPAAEEMTLYDITCVAKCTPEAVQKWEESPWK